MNTPLTDIPFLVQIKIKLFQGIMALLLGMVSYAVYRIVVLTEEEKKKGGLQLE